MKTSIATSDSSSITVRGKDLVTDLMGKVGFTEMMYRHFVGRFPTKGETLLLDTCLVTLMEHGITPSALIARLVADSLPDQLQVAVASGLNAVGPVFVGTMEGCGHVLRAAVAASNPDAYCTNLVREYLAAGRRLPGFGHPFHKPDDPRTPRLFEIARSVDLYGRYCARLCRLNEILDAEMGRHVTINATGGVAALLLEAGLEPDIFRGVAVVSRSAGLVAHIQEERIHPAARRIWSLVEENMEYSPDDSVSFERLPQDDAGIGK